MTIARLLVPVRGDGKGEGVLGHAAALARPLDAHIEAMHCRARPDDLIPYGVIVPAALRDQIRAQAGGIADAEERHLRGMFESLMQRLGIARVDADAMPPRDRPSASWIEQQGRQMDVIRAHGRLADIVVVARPDRDRNLGVNTLKAALFQTGRPVLVCPPVAPPAVLGARIAIAWNGSLEAARTVALAQPLILAAAAVTVLDGGAADHGASGAALLRYLAARGVEAVRREIRAGDHPGRTLLADAAAAGADLLMMGAYGHSRDYEAVFGGATQHVVDTAQIPVVMAH